MRNPSTTSALLRSLARDRDHRTIVTYAKPTDPATKAATALRLLAGSTAKDNADATRLALHGDKKPTSTEGA